MRRELADEVDGFWSMWELGKVVDDGYGVLILQRKGWWLCDLLIVTLSQSTRELGSERGGSQV